MKFTEKDEHYFIADENGKPLVDSNGNPIKNNTDSFVTGKDGKLLKDTQGNMIKFDSEKNRFANGVLVDEKGKSVLG